jgi:hypothetical protein
MPREVVCWLPLRVCFLALKAVVRQRPAPVLRQTQAPLLHQQLHRPALAVADLSSGWTGLRLWNWPSPRMVPSHISPV